MSTAPKLLGVLGGMGPAATVKFLEVLVSMTPADCDQEHLPVIVSFAPHIPDRTAAILDNGDDPSVAMQVELARLQQAGAKLICIPCNTAHFWFDALAAAASVPMLHIVDAVADRLAFVVPLAKRVGLLATSGTLAAKVYHGRLANHITWVAPDAAVQESQSNLSCRSVRTVATGDPAFDRGAKGRSNRARLHRTRFGAPRCSNQCAGHRL
jgi:aspartate racemase